MKFLYARMLLVVLAVLSIAAGCNGTGAKRPDQIVYAAHGVYAAELRAALEYKALPTCQPEALPVARPKFCKDPDVLKKLQEADNEAFKALSTAQAAVRQGDGTQGAAEATAAQKAVENFRKQTKALPKGNS